MVTWRRVGGLLVSWQLKEDKLLFVSPFLDFERIPVSNLLRDILVQLECFANQARFAFRPHYSLKVLQPSIKVWC
jgi:hypothetical protein